jgi:hypothetical protein
MVCEEGENARLSSLVFARDWHIFVKLPGKLFCRNHVPLVKTCKSKVL